MYDNLLSGRIANSIVQLMVISGNYRWLLGLRPRPHQGGCSSPLDPRLLPGSMLRIDMAWPPGKYRFQRPLLKSSSGSKGCCGTGFRTLPGAWPNCDKVAAFSSSSQIAATCKPVATPMHVLVLIISAAMKKVIPEPAWRRTWLNCEAAVKERAVLRQRR